MDRLLFHRQPESNDETKRDFQTEREIYSRGLCERTFEDANRPKSRGERERERENSRCNGNYCQIIQKKKEQMRKKEDRFSRKILSAQYEYFLLNAKRGERELCSPRSKKETLTIVDEHQRYRYVYLSKDREDIRRQCCVSSIVIRCIVTNHNLEKKRKKKRKEPCERRVKVVCSPRTDEMRARRVRDRRGERGDTIAGKGRETMKNLPHNTRKR